MKILNFNLERFKHNKQAILSQIESFDADIIVLTETSSALNLNYTYTSVSIASLPEFFENIKYKAGENRTTIWTRYPILKSFKTYDHLTTVCSEIQTEFGILNVYGTIIGVFGGKGPRFEADLQGQLNDWDKFDLEKANCIDGDLNVFFSGYAYPSHKARNTLNEAFKKLKMQNLTSEIPENVDHIVISNEFLNGKKTAVEIFNLDKKLSDHIGICVTIFEE